MAITSSVASSRPGTPGAKWVKKGTYAAQNCDASNAGTGTDSVRVAG